MEGIVVGCRKGSGRAADELHAARLQCLAEHGVPHGEEKEGTLRIGPFSLHEPLPEGHEAKRRGEGIG